MFKFKVGDTVKVTSGKDKGREGKIEMIFPKEGTALIPEVNIYKKHVKPAVTADKKGGIFSVPRPLNFAKIALICPKCKKITRVGIKDKKRICKKCGKAIDSITKKRKAKK
ncbi:MAG: 50S ribosomal protein L24 [Candidatus Woesebacteria bacterium GW2011_GWC1_43_10b]|uniref:Large ribosomal subunit protein uL24 n=2 Tax=Candidatus Woeseibacteriota TaxID=1752722 RepID=A0A0G1IR97_9BACT|nr:MAG: 50S ribosomal protein L24 [Candidatus Woesebacteria bacterium GW2011_GWC1_43_10b]KKT34302.1 MAG: 50S ribosomal protein L24 [Candidatus Woesebacteria bacterium GW2011_GWB1_44_11b]